jgi:hypothetical protein
MSEQQEYQEPEPTMNTCEGPTCPMPVEPQCVNGVCELPNGEMCTGGVCPLPSQKTMSDWIKWAVMLFGVPILAFLVYHFFIKNKQVTAPTV